MIIKAQEAYVSSAEDADGVEHEFDTFLPELTLEADDLLDGRLQVAPELTEIEQKMLDYIFKEEGYDPRAYKLAYQEARIYEEFVYLRGIRYEMAIVDGELEIISMVEYEDQDLDHDCYIRGKGTYEAPENEDHRGLDYYDQMWYESPPIPIGVSKAHGDEIDICLADSHHIEQGDMVYAGGKSYEVLYVFDMDWITVRGTEWNPETQEVTVYHRSKRKNVDHRDPYYDGWEDEIGIYEDSPIYEEVG